MQPLTGMLSAFTLSAAMFFGIAALAADLPKEGTFTATYSGYGTYKVTPVGKELWFLSFDENGLTVGSGLLDHMTWHCWGVGDGKISIVQDRGYCVLTDPAGDQIATDTASDGKVDLSKPYGVTNAIMMGTGKYAGITGSWTFVVHTSEFKMPEGSYVQYSLLKGSYKLP